MNWRNLPSTRPTRRPLRALCAALAAACAALVAAPAHAAPGDTGSAAATADVAVVFPLTIIKMKDMSFGKIAPTPTAGTVVLNATDSLCTTTGGLLHIGSCQAAQFGGMGAKNMFVRLNTPASITLTGPGASMLIDTITLDTSPDLQQQANGNGNGNGNNKRYKIITPSGIFSFNLGGTLHVGANQAAGVYSATFSVTAVYQ